MHKKLRPLPDYGNAHDFVSCTFCVLTWFSIIKFRVRNGPAPHCQKLSLHLLLLPSCYLLHSLQSFSWFRKQQFLERSVKNRVTHLEMLGISPDKHVSPHMFAQICFDSFTVFTVEVSFRFFEEKTLLSIFLLIFFHNIIFVKIL